MTLITKLFVYNRPLASAIFMASASISLIIDPFMIHGLIENYTINGVFTVLAGIFLNYFPLGYLLFTMRNHVFVQEEKKKRQIKLICLKRLQSQRNKTVPQKTLK